MNIIKKSVYIILLLLIALYTTACASHKEMIVGKWACEIDYGKQIEKTLSANMPADILNHLELNDIKIKLTAEFDNGGNAVFSIDEKSAKETFDRLADALVKAAVKNLEEIYPQEFGMSIDEYLAQVYMTKDDLEAQIKEQLNFNIEEIFGQSTFEVEYSVDGDKLYMGKNIKETVQKENYLKISLSATQFKITDASSSQIQADLGEDMPSLADMLPLVFDRLN